MKAATVSLLLKKLILVSKEMELEDAVWEHYSLKS